jgi:hypothetical protein
MSERDRRVRSPSRHADFFYSRVIKQEGKAHLGKKKKTHAHPRRRPQCLDLYHRPHAQLKALDEVLPDVLPHEVGLDGAGVWTLRPATPAEEEYPPRGALLLRHVLTRRMLIARALPPPPPPVMEDIPYASTPLSLADDVPLLPGDDLTTTGSFGDANDTTIFYDPYATVY